MSETMSAQIIGAKELAVAFSAMPEITTRAFKQAIGKAAYSLASKAKELAPVLYGALRGSIHVQGPDVVPGNVRAIVGTNLKYAPWQEYGTGVYAGRGMITPKRAKMLAWKDRAGWHFAKAVRGVKGKFYFRGAKEHTRPILSDLLREALAEIVGHLARD